MKVSSKVMSEPKNLRFFAGQAAKKWPLRGSLKSRVQYL